MDESQISYANVKRLMADGWQIDSICTCPTGVLFALTQNGLQGTYYASGLHVGRHDLATELVARLAAEAGYGRFEDLLDKYHCVLLQSGKLEPSVEDLDFDELMRDNSGGDSDLQAPPNPSFEES
jgi:hypothetical protein